MDKHHKAKKIKIPHKNSPQRKRGLLFVLIFGALMTIVGVVRLFAAPYVGMWLNPNSQSATPGQTKSVIVYLDSGTKDVNGGTVQLKYDANRLTFIPPAEPATGEFYITGQGGIDGWITINFRSTRSGGIDGQFNLLRARFKVRPLTGTHKTQITGTARAYEGNSNPEYYPTSNLSASITITGSSAPAPAPSPPAPSPSPPAPSPPSGNPSPPSSPPSSPSSPGAPSTSSPAPTSTSTSPGSPSPTSRSPNTVAATDPGQTSNNEEGTAAPGDDDTLLPQDDSTLNLFGETAFDPDSEEASERSASFPAAAFFGFVILVADGVFYFFYRKRRIKRTGYGQPEQTDTPPPIPSWPANPPPTNPQPLAPPAEPGFVQEASQSAKRVMPSMPVMPTKQTWDDIRREQAERIAHGNKSSTEKDLPDMFELAKQHPESYGSQLYNENPDGEAPPKPKQKK